MRIITRTVVLSIWRVVSKQGNQDLELPAESVDDEVAGGSENGLLSAESRDIPGSPGELYRSWSPCNFTLRAIMLS
jgi:hypothetical protein